MKILDLPQRFWHVVRATFGERRCDRAMHTVSTHHDDVADLAVLNTLEQLLSSAAVTNHQTHAALQILLIGLGGKFQHPFGRRPVGSQRFLHEHVQALVDRVLEVHPSKRQRSRQDHNVTRFERIHRMLVSIEANELPFLRYIDFLRRIDVFIGKSLHTASHVLRKHIRHRDDFQLRVVHMQRIIRRPRPTTTRPNQSHLNHIRSLLPMHRASIECRPRRNTASQGR